MIRLLVVLTVAEILLLVLVLAIYLMVITTRLRSIGATLANVAFGVRAVEEQVASIAPPVLRVNQALGEIAQMLPKIANNVQRYARAYQ